MKMVRGVNSAYVVLISTKDTCFPFNRGINCVFQYGNCAHLLGFRLFNFCINLELEVKEISQIPVGTTDSGSGSQKARKLVFFPQKFFKSDRDHAKLTLCLPSGCGHWLSSTSAPQGD